MYTPEVASRTFCLCPCPSQPGTAPPALYSDDRVSLGQPFLPSCAKSRRSAQRWDVDNTLMVKPAIAAVIETSEIGNNVQRHVMASKLSAGSSWICCRT